MNKQELIEKFESLSERGYLLINMYDVLRNVEQLDEPQKVTIPQFVEDWIEEAKKATYNIRGAIEMARDERVKDWLELKNVDTFAEAWVNGYDVEKEKRYYVRLKNIREDHETLNCEKHSKIWNFSSEEETTLYKTKHTRKELEEAGFGWVFDCEGVEVEEVE